MRAVQFLLAAAIAAGLCLVAQPASAQVYGKNKIQYEKLDWAVFETPHLRMHYYAEEESLARRLTAFAESVCVEFDGRFNMERRNQVPFLLYSAHHLFQQTNATPSFIGEGTGGLTEFIKGRVLLPHTGSWRMLRWVTRHELAHWYMLEKLGRVMRENKRGQGYLPPLWFSEGFAEYAATEWDAQAEGLLRDAFLTDNAVPMTNSESIAGTVLMYKEGQSFLMYVADRFGSEKVFELFENWHRGEDFYDTFKLTFGLPLEVVDQDWYEGLRKRFYPLIAEKARARDAATRLTPVGYYNLGARVVPNADPADSTLRFCYFRASQSGIYMSLNEPDKNGQRKDKKVLKSGQTAKFESFHLFQNRADASPSGYLVVSAKDGGRDALYVVDARKRKVVHKAKFPMLVSINDPCIAPGDSAVIFSAQDLGGRSDLYRVTWDSTTKKKKKVERLTNDDYDDVEPDVSPDGKWVVWASDRCDRAGEYSLFRMSLEDGTIETLSNHRRGTDREPVYSADGEHMLFTSTRDGISDIYMRPAKPSSEYRQITNLVGPASNPDWLPGNEGVLFTGQDGLTFQTYALNVDIDTLEVLFEEPSVYPKAFLAGALHEGDVLSYERRIGLDIVQNGVAYDPAGGAGAGGQMAMSDLLGNEQIFFYIANSSDRFGSFWDGWEGGLTYFNRSRRFHWGIGVFRLNSIYDADFDVVRKEKRTGLTVLGSYPINTFTRIEGSMTLRHASDHLLRDGNIQTIDLVSNFVSIVHDNTQWTYLGPSGGSRIYLSAGLTRDVTYGIGDFTTLLGEYRHYGKIGSQVVSATRLRSQSNQGQNAGRVYLGGRNTIRGYDRRALAGHRTALVQQEFRFPVLRNLIMEFPGRWRFPMITGAVFADAAWARDVDFDYTTQLGAVGTAVFIGGTYMPALRWDFSWITPDWRHFSDHPRTQFTIGFNF